SDWNYDNNEQTTILTITGAYNKTCDIVVKNYPWYYDSATNTYLDQYACGNTPVMIVDVSNNGPDDATGVVVEYVMGNNFQFINLNTQGNGQATYNINTRTITWNIGSIPRGGFVFMKVYLYTIGSGNKTAAMTTTAKLVSVDQNDTNSTNDESSYGLYAPTSADIKVTQTYTTFTNSSGDYVTYSITVTNNGPDNATGIKITDKLPTGLQYAGNSLSTDGGFTWTTNSSAYTSSNGVWNIGNINNGSSPLILNITAKITGTGIIKNRAYLSAKGQSDWNYDNNEQTTIIARPA
ncbi:MAG: DUF11 domain-containing protein, partial [Burkholderiaceae bacterium]|nr:DUF11 domain-containing protein [Burkholderiaceae bacterium]